MASMLRDHFRRDAITHIYRCLKCALKRGIEMEIEMEIERRISLNKRERAFRAYSSLGRSL